MNNIPKIKNYKHLIEYIKSKSSYEKILYLDLGIKIVRVICYSEQFYSIVKKHLTLAILKESQTYDTTIILWQVDDIDYILQNNELYIPIQHRGAFVNDKSITIYSIDKKTVFYGLKTLDIEEFAKEGHVLVKIFNRILKTETTNLVHGACIGLNNNGILLCARGKKGKSTLSVLSMLKGFDYIADDYLLLEKNNEQLYAYPIYSIITLSPTMYNEMYDLLDGTRFISNNGIKTKYVINIANLHDRFKKKYPIKLCMMLEFTEDKHSSIIECSALEKGKAITQTVFSTIKQMNDELDKETIKKLINTLQSFPFYKIKLCSNIYDNVETLKKFLERFPINDNI
ncbi:hypothetical protein IJG14_02110 [bacterium]|nr:hypothetical protein [bacterium]